ncbi:hypothetical protein [Kitasatospora sp. HPMI-4]|uniref:hypothetical protein n=1 Tax=Kitasatospora sp. HPMI-4 TaxID=3448443 RepID=UPI003F19A358
MNRSYADQMREHQVDLDFYQMELIPTEPWVEEPYYLRAVEDGPGLPGTLFTPGDAHDPDLRPGDDDFEMDL